ncbi:hypothetical protein RI543_004769 [Arxiozyma heterogenica]|uniref:Uncharacterized protein n=1 Tax=Arxiozyma heterogenica TaxID=278026 RepID=A0AAN8A6N9_9SACH|nr:hypothetical protein RI543_004769 [Kazachstania heterogenica]
MYFDQFRENNKHSKQALLNDALYLCEIYQKRYFVGITNIVSQGTLIKFCDILNFKYKQYKEMLDQHNTISTKKDLRIQKPKDDFDNDKENFFVSAKQSPEKKMIYNETKENRINKEPLTQKNMNPIFITQTPEKQLDFLLQNIKSLKMDNISKFDIQKDKFQQIISDFQILEKKIFNIKENYTKRIELQISIFNKHIKNYETKCNETLHQKNKQLESANKALQEKEIQLQKLNERIFNLQKKEDKLKQIDLFTIPIGKILLEYMKDTRNDISFEVYFKKNFPNITSFSNISQKESFQSLQREVVEKIESLKNFHDMDTELRHFITSITKVIEQQGNSLTNGIKILYEQVQNLDNKQNCIAEDKNIVESLSLLTNDYSRQINLNNELKNNLTTVQNILKDTQSQLKIELAKNNELNENVQLQNVTLNNLSDQYNKLQGDLAQKLRWKQLKGINRDSNKSKKDLERIEMMSHVELQNIVKQLVIFLDIPIDKIRTQLIKISISLKYERNLSIYFIGNINYQLTGQKINFNKYQKEAFQQFQKDTSLNNIVHPLQTKLDTLLDEVLLKL